MKVIITQHGHISIHIIKILQRQKKQEYLQYQRQLAMQRMQDQEREMQMRIEQQTRQGAQMQAQYGGGYQNPGGMPGKN